MKMKILNVFGIFFLSILGLSAQISGTVFRDFNANGVKENSLTYNEPFVQGVTVTAYSNTGATQSTTTNASGAYTFSGLTLPVRIEFTGYPSGDYSSAVGSGNLSNVQFYLVPSTTANFGIHAPDDYWDNTQDPRYIVPQHVNGLKTGNAGAVAGIVSTPLSSLGLNMNHDDDAGVFGTGPVVRDDILTSNIGTVWGEAYYKDNKQMYFSSFLKRHCDFGDGPGYIYSYNYSGSGNPTFTAKFNLQGVTPSNGGAAIDFGTVTRSGSTDYTLTALKEDPNIDLDAFGKVATMSYGDIDMQPGTGYLWAVNLYQKALIRIDVSSNPTTLPSNINQYILANLPNYPTPVNGTLRPFGLGFNKGKAYLGVVNDASTGTSADLKAYVLEFDPNNIVAGFTVIMNFNPNIKKTSLPAANNYQTWMNVYNNAVLFGTPPFRFWPQAVLSDINFDENNNMYLSFFDRFGHQVGAYNRSAISGSTTNITTGAQGELLKACPTITGWEIEGTGACHLGAEFIDDIGGDANPESTEGAAAILKGTNKLVSIVVDPHPQGATGITYFTSQGVNTYNLTNGQITNWYGIYNGDRPFFGKANGLGDLEFVTPPPPIEIGNRVWNDVDMDGIQDPGEAAISGVSVQLIKAGTVEASAITDNNGNYYFSSAAGTSTPSFRYGVTALMPNMAYTVRIPNYTSQAALVSLSPTTANTGGSGQPDVRDSDGSVIGSNVEATILTSDIPVSGANNHSFDFGFATSSTPPCPEKRCATVIVHKN